MSSRSDRRRYGNPPIEEALVEFRFAPGQEWDLTIPGKLHQHELIGAEYSGKPRQQNTIEAALQTGPQQQPSLSLQSMDRLQPLNEDGKRSRCWS